MHPATAPVKQRAHALVDRMTPDQVTALIELFGPQADSPKLHWAPFCDELPIDGEASHRSRRSAKSKQSELAAPVSAGADECPDDSDFWSTARRSRRAFAPTSAD